MKIKQEHYILAIITLIGGYLRFNNLGLNPFWHDEAFFALTVQNNIWRQEYLPHLIASVFNLHTDYSLRFMSALAGTLSIPSIYFVLKENKWIGVLFIAFNPLFIFWSQLARPYAIAGLFVILAWRYKYLFLLALATTPISLIGFRIRKNERLWIAFIVLLTVGFYIIRPDTDNKAFSNMTIVLNSARWFYLPLIALALSLCDYVIPYSLKRLDIDMRVFRVIGIGVLVFFSFGINTIYQNKTFNDEGITYWYRYECKFSNWRNIGDIDYATELYSGRWYSSNDVGYFQTYSKAGIDSQLNAGDTLKVGVGQLGVNTCYQFLCGYLGQKEVNKYIHYLYSGGVLKIDIWKQNDLESPQDGVYYHKTQVVG